MAQDYLNKDEVAETHLYQRRPIPGSDRMRYDEPDPVLAVVPDNSGTMVGAFNTDRGAVVGVEYLPVVAWKVYAESADPVTVEMACLTEPWCLKVRGGRGEAPSWVFPESSSHDSEAGAMEEAALRLRGLGQA